MKIKTVILIIYFILLIIPIYWMINTSFKTNFEIGSMITLVPEKGTAQNYISIFTSPIWMKSFLQTLTS